MDAALLGKLATMFGLMQNFSTSGLSKEHIMKFLQVIATSDLGKVLLQIAAKLRSADGFGHVFLITTKVETKELAVIFFVESTDKIVPVIDILKAVESLCAQHGIKLEIDTMKNATNGELVKF